VLLGGNNGVPLLGEIEALPKAGAAVMELSSFQLMTVTAPPSVAIITNVTPNHLDWHRGMEEYIAAKCRIFDARTHLVLNGENAVTRELAQRRLQAGVAGATVLFSPSEGALPSVPDAVFTRGGRIVLRRGGAEHVLDCLGDLRLTGRHNLENLLAALAAADAIAPLTEATVSAALRGFAGVPHRLESVGNVGGVAYINSSIDTSPTRTAAALAALCCRPLVIAGGRGKGVSLAPLGESLVRHAKGVFLYGEAGEEIENAIDGRVPTERFFYFDDAFRAASNAAQAGDTVLLSPGCTAFGEFRDFEARGERFRRLVLEKMWPRQ
jgi:UDP-N-acetylmuramoylalanine--D-glutamate ligase